MTQEQEKAAIKRARKIIQICGGVARVAKIVGRSPTRVYSWTYTRDRHGTGGMIPPECQQVLLEHARRNDLALTPKHFFPPEEDAA